MVLILLATPLIAQEFKITRAKVDYAKDLDFAAFHTYAWKPSQDPGENEAAHATVVFHIERALEASGLTRAETAADADLLVRYYTSFQNRVRSSASQERVIEPSNQRTSVDFSRAIDGTLVIELYRPSDDLRVWRGSTSDTTGKRRFSDEQVRSAVDLILSEYPPKSEGGEMGPSR